MSDEKKTAKLTRGVPTGGGPKYVRTQAGARVYGVPIGTPISRDMQQAAGAQGSLGGPMGTGIRGPQNTGAQPNPVAPGTPVGGGPGSPGQSQVLGGGVGAIAQHLGGVTTETLGPEDTPRRVFGNPQAPGASLLQFPDGSLALMDANGNTSPRQFFDVAAFVHLGWQVTPATPAARASLGAAAQLAFNLQSSPVAPTAPAPPAPAPAPPPV